MIKRVLPFLLACVLLAATGCDTMKSSWKSTRKLYKEYVNVDPAIDLKAQAESDPSVLKLASLFTPVDERLEFMLRALSSQESPPGREWCEAFLSANPWLTGLAVLGASGSVNVKLPSFSLKQVDYSPMIDFEALYKKRKMAAYVEEGDLGSEVLVGQPLYSNNEFAGVLVVNFDPAALAKFSPDPDKLIIVSSSGAALWGGKDAATAKALAKHDWKKILAGDVSGEMREGGQRYLWQTRYLAHIQIVYMVAEVPPQPRKFFSSEKSAPAQQAPATAPQAAPAPAK